MQLKENPVCLIIISSLEHISKVAIIIYFQVCRLVVTVNLKKNCKYCSLLPMETVSELYTNIIASTDKAVNEAMILKLYLYLYDKKYVYYRYNSQKVE